jgi:hypothetical protein
MRQRPLLSVSQWEVNSFAPQPIQDDSLKAFPEEHEGRLRFNGDRALFSKKRCHIYVARSLTKFSQIHTILSNTDKGISNFRMGKQQR